MALIKQINFEQILPIWRDHLWPGRTSPIEPASAIKFGMHPFEYFDLANVKHKIHYAAYKDNQIIGVNSVHDCPENIWRSRGLYVFPEFRGQGVGTELLKHGAKIAAEFSARGIWSMPRVEALAPYSNARFMLQSKTFGTETSDQNCFVWRSL